MPKKPKIFRLNTECIIHQLFCYHQRKSFNYFQKAFYKLLLHKTTEHRLTKKPINIDGRRFTLVYFYNFYFWLLSRRISRIGGHMCETSKFVTHFYAMSGGSIHVAFSENNHTDVTV